MSQIITPRVLVVDDDLNFGNQCVKMLLDHRYDVLFSDNAEKAKLHILNSNINIAIIDLMLPPTFDIEGLDLYRYILSKNRNIKILFMTSRDKGVTEIVAAAIKMGAADFLDKNNKLFFDKLLVSLKEMDFSGEKNASKTENDDIHKKLTELRQIIDIGFGDMKRGDAALYSKLSNLENGVIENIRVLIQQDRVEQGEIIQTLDAIRRTLKFIQSADLIYDSEFIATASTANDILKSDLDLHQKLELTLPIIPLFMNYKVELSSGSNLDLQGLLAEIEERWVSLKNKKS